MNERPRLNPILCSARGLCAELLPEQIDLDEWGYRCFRTDRSPRSGVLSPPGRYAGACPGRGRRTEGTGGSLTLVSDETGTEFRVCLPTSNGSLASS
jgi:ferredoxin